MLESKSYNTYYAFTSREKTPTPKIKTKAKVAKSDKKKQPAKMPKAKGLDVLSKVALTEAEQLKLATKRSKTRFHSSHASGSGDGVDTQSKGPDEQHLKTTGADEGTGTIPWVPDVPIYEYESEKESWGDSEDEDNENDSDDLSDEGDDDNDGNNGNDDDDANDDDKQESDDTNDDDERTNKEKINDEETMDQEEDDEVTKELYDDVNVNLGNKDTKMTNADQVTPVLESQKADEPVQSYSVSSDFSSKLLNLKNPSPADNEIASLLDTTAHRTTAVPEITSSFTIIIPPPPLFFNPLSQQATPTPTPTASETTTSTPVLPDFAYVFKFNERVTNLEKDLSEIKQVDQYAQALSSIRAIDEKNAYIELIDTSMRATVKEEVNTQLPQILPQAISDVTTPVIEKNVNESLEAIVLIRSSSQPQSSYEAGATLSEFELTKILIDKIKRNKSYDIADHKRELYDALVKSYQINKDLFDSYGEVFSLKRSRDNKDKDQDPSVGSYQRSKRRKTSKEAESSRDSRSKEKKSSSTSKDASQSQHKSSGKSAHAEKPSHTIEDSGMQQDQEFVTGDNEEQPADKEVTKPD
ncbi:hypothetical protein Tco_0689358 [Tanacetum coccineum]